MSADAIFFLGYTQKIFYVKNPLLIFKVVLYVLKTHFDCFNNKINNLDNMERDPFFIIHKTIF